MKRLIPVFLVFVLGCGGPSLELEKAIKVSENVIQTIKVKKYNFSDCYTKDFFNEVSEQQWINDLNKMDSLLGPIESYQMTEYNIENNLGEPSDIILVYDIKHSKFKSHFIFTIIIEDEKYKIAGHRIKSDAL